MLHINRGVHIVHIFLVQSFAQALHRFADPSVSHGDWKIPNGGVYVLECGADGRASSCETLPEFLFAPAR